MIQAPTTRAQEVSEPDWRAECARLVRALEDAHKMAALGRLVAGVVHEINTPIASILSNNEVIRRSLESVRKQVGETAPARAVEILDTLSSLAAVDKIACERIQEVIRSLKTFARVDQGDLREVDIHEILRSTIKLCGCEFRRRIDTQADFGQLPKVECYPHLLGQAFLNIMVNAGQAIDGEGRITVRTRPENGNVVVSIADTGRGIPADHRDRIFRGGFTTKAVGVGTGLGLKITREIVEDHHNGSIWFESEVGAGTTFFVRIPVKQPARS